MKNKLYIVIMILFIITIFSINISAAELKDVSKDHWAYKSVKKLVDKGYLSLYEDGTFKGNNKVTRYELAVIIARMLNDLQNTDTQITENDADSLRKLSLEFRNELVEVAKKQENLFNNAKKLKDKNILQDQAIGKNRETINNLETELSNIIENIMQLKELNSEIDKLNKKINDQTATINNLNEKIASNNTSITNIDEKINNMSNEVDKSEIIKNLEDQQSVTVTNLHSLKEKVNSLNSNLEKKEKTISELQKQNKQFKMYFIVLTVLSIASF